MKVAVIGAGPGGMQAALSASEAGATVTLIDENTFPGGQIWRKGQRPSPKRFTQLNARLQEASIERLFGHAVTDIAPSEVWLDGPDAGTFSRRFDKMILAPGARERFLPFPGWTLPNVMGAGGLQAMVKSGLDVRAKRVVIAGSGPLLLAVAAYLKKSGAKLLCIAEQAPMGRLIGFGGQLPVGKVWEGLQLKLELLGVRHVTNAWVTRASGSERLESVTLKVGSSEQTLSCDYLASSYGLVPNTELFSQLSVELDKHFVSVDEHQQTSVPGIYAVGEATGIGGVDKALAEARVAGLHAAGKAVPRALTSARDGHRSFVQRMERAFSPREELKSLCEDDTLICRCEDVSYGALKACHDQRSAKLYTRCGMGACQGRICGSINRDLFQWESNRVRPPILPVPMGRVYQDGAEYDSEGVRK
jgi:NADPH-dependent 2,4-dienoyl-CoA reductase/sulfur reductase-like enzyme